MRLCTCVSEEGEDGEGVVSEALSLLSLDTHRRKVTGAHGTLSSLSTDIRRKAQFNYAKKTEDM